MLILQFLGALLHQGLQTFILGANDSFKILLPKVDLSLSGIQRCLVICQAPLPSHDIFPHHLKDLLLPHERLELLVVPFTQL